VPDTVEVLRKRFSPAAHPNLSDTHDGTPQSFASRKGGTKLYMTINMYLHIDPCPIRMQAYRNKTYHMLDKTIDGEPVCVCVYYELFLRKTRYCLFLTITCEYTIIKIRGTAVAEHCSRTRRLCVDGRSVFTALNIKTCNATQNVYHQQNTNFVIS
jgi:hypothetical protein